MKRKHRHYEDYRELGRHLYQAQSSIQHAYIYMANEMYRKSDPRVRMLARIERDLFNFRSKIDNDFCSDVPEADVPEGEPNFPIFPGKFNAA
jgi:hypothetical protein